MAIAQLAVFDAVNSIDPEYSPYLVSSSAPAGASPDAAAIAAAHYVLVQLYPAAQVTLDASFAASLAAIPDGNPKTAGVTWGESVAQQIVALRANDGSATVVPYVPGSGPGIWIPTPPAFLPALLPGWGLVTPFFLNSGDQFRVDSPPDLTSDEYTKAFLEIKQLGSALAVRTQDQSDVPRFWLVPGTQGWNSTARQEAIAEGTSLSQNARIFALLNVTGADAAIACWDTKFTYNTWRPVTAIRVADLDGKPGHRRRSDNGHRLSSRPRSPSTSPAMRAMRERLGTFLRCSSARATTRASRLRVRPPPVSPGTTPRFSRLRMKSTTLESGAGSTSATAKCAGVAWVSRSGALEPLTTCV